MDLRRAKPLLFIWGIPLFWGCSRSADERLAQVNKRQSVIDGRVAADEKRAADLRAEVKQLERVLEMQQRCFVQQVCWVQVARVNAAIAAELSECNLASANWFACDAERTRNKADGTGLGCLLGWGVAVATGGSVAPSIAIGCGLGSKHGESNTTGICVQQSRPRPCGQLHHVFVQRALAALELPSMPTCERIPHECELLNSSSH